MISLTKSRELIRKVIVIINLLIIYVGFTILSLKRERIYYVTIITFITNCRKKCKIMTRGILVNK
jgi:hypothetical protein